MTRNQVAYHELQEKIRADKASEDINRYRNMIAEKEANIKAADQRVRQYQIEQQVGAMPYDKFIQGLTAVGSFMKGASGFVA